jgi:hypothetical protein
MTGLEPRADQAVRDAVDAFIEGRLSPGYSGETVFETKNSRYRLMDGILFSAPDASLIGAELVGWLIETRKRSTVASTWQATSRAVLVDRKRGRHIIVTSSTRMLHLEEEPLPAGSSENQAGSSVHPPVWEESVAAAPPPQTPAPSPRVHAPPRPMQPRIPQATAPKPLSRPLPYPSAPPRRVSPAPQPTAAAARMGPLPPPGRLPLPPPRPPPHRPVAALDQELEPIDSSDETEATEPNGEPFLLARPATGATPTRNRL